MDIIISHSSKAPIYQQIKQQIKQTILKGALEPRAALPSIRKLAKDLHVSVITTKRAYDELEKEGLIESIVGKGSFVAGQNQEWMKEQKLRLIEDHLQLAMAEAKALGLSLDEVTTILTLLFKEES